MGGKALKQYGVITERKDTNIFNEIGNGIKQKLFNDFQLETTIVKCYRNKQNHGDLDLLIKIDHKFHNKGINFKNYINKTFNPNAIHNNGGVYSFDYQNFQIDFIPIKETNWEIAQTYFNYDCLGNCMGKTFHKFGLSYGWEGLFYKYRNFNGRNSQNILISKNPQKIFDFGGYNYNKFLNGFDSLEEIFQFVINGKYFDNKIFQFENLRQIDKKRNKKRATYHQFLNFLKENNIISTYNFNKNKDNYLPMINDYFPEANFYEKLSILNRKNDINKLLSEKFNGRIIMNWFPELKGKELGSIIIKFKTSLGNDYTNFILNNNENIIKKFFTKIYNKK